MKIFQIASWILLEDIMAHLYYKVIYHFHNSNCVEWTAPDKSRQRRWTCFAKGVNPPLVFTERNPAGLCNRGYMNEMHLKPSLVKPPLLMTFFSDIQSFRYFANSTANMRWMCLFRLSGRSFMHHWSGSGAPVGVEPHKARFLWPTWGPHGFWWP